MSGPVADPKNQGLVRIAIGTKLETLREYGQASIVSADVHNPDASLIPDGSPDAETILEAVRCLHHELEMAAMASVIHVEAYERVKDLLVRMTSDTGGAPEPTCPDCGHPLTIEAPTTGGR